MGPFVPEGATPDRKKARSRYLLPMEMLLYTVMVIVAIHGFFIGIVRSNTSWILGLGIVGGVGFHVAIIEWNEGFNWTFERLRHWVYMRKWLSSISITCWAYVLYELAGIEDPGRGATLFIGILLVLPFHAWAWWVNFRTWVVLSPRFATRKLEAELETARRRW